MAGNLPYVPPPDWSPPPDYGVQGLPPDLASLLPPPVAPFHAEMPQFQPYQPPGVWQSALASLAQMQAPGWNRSGDWGPAIAAGFLRGLGGSALLRLQQKELLRQNANQTAQAQAAAKNEANLKATQEQAKARSEYVAGLVRRGAARAESDQATTTAQKNAGLVTTEMARAYGWPASVIGKRVSELTPAQQAAMPRQASGIAGGDQFDPDMVAQGMIEGNLAADPSGYSRGQWGAIATSLQKRGVKAREMQLDWVGTKKFWTQRNSAQQLNILQNLERLGPSLDLVQSLSDDLEATVRRYGVKILNRANLNAAANGAYGKEAASAAQNLMTQINDTVFELQQVYGNGYSPTDQALKIASENLRSDWNSGVLRSAIQLAKKNVAIRRASVANIGPVTPSNPTGAPEAQQPDYIFQNGKLVKVQR